MNEEAVGKKDFISDNHIKTLVAIVSKDASKNFLARYEEHPAVIPGSCKEFKKI